MNEIMEWKKCGWKDEINYLRMDGGRKMEAWREGWNN